MEIFTKKSLFERGMAIELDCDESSYGWLLTSPSTTAFSKMHLSTPRRHQNSASLGSLDTDGSVKSSDTTSSPSDTASDDEYFFSYGSRVEISDQYSYRCSIIDEESERLWALWLLEDKSPLHITMKSAEEGTSHTKDSRPRIDDGFILPALAYDANSKTCSKSCELDPVTSSNAHHETLSHIPEVPPKDGFLLSSPLTPTKEKINYSQPQHAPCSSNTSFNTTPPQFPPRTSSRHDDANIYSVSPSSSFRLPVEDFMGKMQKSVFDWDSDDDEDNPIDDDDEKVELPEWLRKISSKRGLTHKDPLKTTPEFAGKQKKKSKSFGGLGEVLKRSLRNRRSGDF